MSDSLLFDGIDDRILFTTGNLENGTFIPGPITMAAIVKRATAINQDAIAYGVSAAGTPKHFGMSIQHPLNSDSFIYENSSSVLAAGVGAVVDTDGWVLVAASKAAGSVAPRLHKYVYNTDTWSHADSGTIQANGTGPTNTGFFAVGQKANADYFDGNILIVAVWDRILADVEIETLIEHKPAWEVSVPAEGYRLDSMSAITTFSATGAGTESSRVGTTLDVGDVPAGWSDTLPPSYASPGWFDNSIVMEGWF